MLQGLVRLARVEGGVTTYTTAIRRCKVLGLLAVSSFLSFTLYNVSHVFT